VEWERQVVITERAVDWISATLDKFSTSGCQSKFPVAVDRDRHIMKNYDAALGFLTPYADRTSYVVTADGPDRLCL
jgi:hypothetical protein